MADDRYTFTQARTRLEEIVAQVRKKDTTLEHSLDLLEEGVRLANVCTELSDHNEWRTVAGEHEAQDAPASEGSPDGDPSGGSAGGEPVPAVTPTQAEDDGDTGFAAVDGAEEGDSSTDDAAAVGEAEAE